jgi:hypothetical protein
MHAQADRTVWLDPHTGAGAGVDGQSLSVACGASGLELAHVLRLAELEHATRVMLTGDVVPRGWFLTPVPAPWIHGAHHLDHETPTGRYLHTFPDGHTVQVEVRRAAEWFGAGTYTPATARAAWAALARTLEAHHRTGAVLLRSPGATGRDLWLRAVGGEVPEPLPLELQALIRSTSPQHRIEVCPPARDVMPAVWVMDGRWMYAALTNGLGIGPARMLTGAQGAELLEADPYARARYRVARR